MDLGETIEFHCVMWRVGVRLTAARSVILETFEET